MKFIDMFCGIGTIRMGMEQAGHKCVYSIEWDKHKRRIYNVIFGNEPEASDIMAVRADELPAADIWCFGAPCQDFSIAGKREGLEGDRSSLVREVFRLVREIKEEYRPEWLLYENVKGMFSSNKGLDYFEILFEMGELGYDCEWQLLNSKDYGVPQNRERVFTIGHLRRYGRRKVFPIQGNNIEIIKDNGLSFIDLSTQECKTTDYSRALQARYNKGYSHRKGETSGVLVRPCLTPDRVKKRQNGRRFKEDGEPMFTLTKQDIHGVWLKKAVGNNPFVLRKYKEFVEKNGYIPKMFNPYNCSEIKNIAPTMTAQGATVTKSSTVLKYQEGRIRRLTPKECWRLQGIPDSITDKVQAAGISDTQMYRGAGDACTVNVIYEIAKRF